MSHINSYSVIATIGFILFLNDSMRETSLLYAMSLFIMSSANGLGKKHVQVWKFFIAVLTEFLKS